jgi:hypothetical protein
LGGGGRWQILKNKERVLTSPRGQAFLSIKLPVSVTVIQKEKEKEKETEKETEEEKEKEMRRRQSRKERKRRRRKERRRWRDLRVGNLSPAMGRGIDSRNRVWN